MHAGTHVYTLTCIHTRPAWPICTHVYLPGSLPSHLGTVSGLPPPCHLLKTFISQCHIIPGRTSAQARTLKSGPQPCHHPLQVHCRRPLNFCPGQEGEVAEKEASLKDLLGNISIYSLFEKMRRKIEEIWSLTVIINWDVSTRLEKDGWVDWSTLVCLWMTDTWASKPKGEDPPQKWLVPANRFVALVA